MPIFMYDLCRHGWPCSLSPAGMSWTEWSWCQATSLSSLDWWLDPKSVRQVVPFVTPSPSLTLVSDASDLGWGAHLDELNTQGCWLYSDLGLHMNVMELKAVCQAFQSFLFHLKGRVVQVLMDNTAAVYYINKQVGARSSGLCWGSAQPLELLRVTCH